MYHALLRAVKSIESRDMGRFTAPGIPINIFVKSFSKLSLFVKIKSLYLTLSLAFSIRNVSHSAPSHIKKSHSIVRRQWREQKPSCLICGVPCGTSRSCTGLYTLIPIITQGRDMIFHHILGLFKISTLHYLAERAGFEPAWDCSQTDFECHYL